MDQKFLCDFYRMTGKKFKRNVKSYLNILLDIILDTCIGGENGIKKL